jgi:mannosyltransferase
MILRAMCSKWMAAIGTVLVVAAILVPNAFFEQVSGRAPHSLAWGPVLFRVLLALHGLILVLASFAKPQSHSPLAAGINRRTWFLLAALTSVAVLLRIPSLNSCLWLDEVLTMVSYGQPPLAWIFTAFPDQNQHLLYSLLAHVSMQIFGQHAWTLRLPSVLFGVASVWALFFLGRRLVGKTQALLACALMTVSYHHIWFSGNARGYMGLLFFTLLATWLWLEAMDRDDWRTWLFYAGSVVMGLWIHMTMLFVVAAHAAIFGLVWLRTGRHSARLAKAVVAFTLCATIALQLYALALPEFIRTAVSEVSPDSEWTNPLWVLRETLRSLRIGFAGSAVVLGGAVMIAAGLLDIFRRQPRAAWAMLLPPLLGGGSMLALGHNLWPRFFFYSMGFGLLIVVHGAMEMPNLVLRLLRIDRGRWAERAGYGLVTLTILASMTTVPRAYALPKQDFTGARDFVISQLGAGDKVVVVGLAAHAYSKYYAPQWPVADTARELATLRPTGARVFLLYTLPIELKAAHPDVWQTVEAEFETVRVFPGTLGGGEVYVSRDRQIQAGISAH